jgi:ribosomal protein S18 acetylase RimI-like enzyme
MGVVVLVDHAEPRLAAEIVDLQQASYAVEADLIGFDQIPTQHETASQVSQLDLIVLGAVEGDGRLVGILGYRRVDDLVDIDRLAVHPSWFRKGVARSLMHDLHRREHDAATFEVSTAAGNTPAIALYASLGYRREPDLPSPAGLTFARFARRADPV